MARYSGSVLHVYSEDDDDDDDIVDEITTLGQGTLVDSRSKNETQVRNHRKEERPVVLI